MLLRRKNNSNISTIANFQWCLYFFIAFIALFCNSELYAAAKKEPVVKAHDNPSTLIEYLIQEKNTLNLTVNTAKRYLSPQNKKEFNSQQEKINASLTIIDAKIESLNSFASNEKKQNNDLNQKLKYLQQLPLNNNEINIQERVAKTETLLTISDKTLELIDENINLAQQLKLELLDQLKKLHIWQEQFDFEQQLSLIKTKKAELNERLYHLYQSNLVKDKKQKNSSVKIDNEALLLINNQDIALVHYDLNSRTIEKRTIKADIAVLNNLDTKSLQIIVDVYKDAINQIQEIEHSLNQMQKSFEKEIVYMAQPDLKKRINMLQIYLNEQLKFNNNLKNASLKKLANYQLQLKKLISTRQSLAQYNINSWPIILNKISTIPFQLYKYLKTLFLKVYDSYSWLDLLPTAVLWLSLSVILILFIAFNHVLKSLRVNKERSRLTGYLYDGILIIIQRNIPYLCLLVMLRVVFYFTSIAYSNYQLLTSLITVWFTFRILILIARLALLERLSDVSGKDVKLYYRLKWLFLFGGWAAALMVIGHQMPLALIVQDIFNRLFMLFILTISLVLWKSKDVIPYLLMPFLSGQKRYLKNAVSLLIILVPITLFTTAIIGLFGFVNLAWTMSGYQAYILSIVVGYIIARGLLADFLELLSEWMISSLENGWLWIEVFLKPLDKILRVILLLLSIFILFQIFGWHSDSFVMINLNKIAHYTIINFTGIYITVQSIIEFFIVLSIFIWAAKWTREFCYRWLYKHAKDVAIRNSLSIFTQYAVIILGTFITLHVLGLDLSGMSMILGGLAVGMGFGLRDFASNIVGGIMLLIERPVREGDLITLGEHEGRVAHIGIRTMRVSSWDNMEVLIPNAETFNKPFTNWTLQDSIVRTVIPIKVCRSDDPAMVQQLILDVLTFIPEIVPDPPVQVFLKKIDEALIEFEVRYFINVQTHSRVEIRSKVLFAITAQFKAAGIKPPIEPVAIEIKEGQHHALKPADQPPKNGN